MKLLVLFLVFLPALVSAQQPIKPTPVSVNSKSQNMEAAQSDIATLTNEIRFISDQMKGLKEQVNSLRQQQGTLATERTAKQNELNSIRLKKDRSTSEEAQVQKLESEIKNIDSRMQSLQSAINAKTGELVSLERSTQQIEYKIEKIEQRPGQDQIKKKDDSNDLTTEAGITYAKMKLILDSLPAEHKYRLTNGETSTLTYFDNVFRTNPAFASATLKELNFLKQKAATNNVKKTTAFNTDYGPAFEKIKQYLQQLSAIRQTGQL